MELFLKITLAIVAGIMLIRLWPSVKHWSTNSPKGSSQEWMNLALILAAVIGFVFLLIYMVKG